MASSGGGTAQTKPPHLIFAEALDGDGDSLLFGKLSSSDVNWIWRKRRCAREGHPIRLWPCRLVS